MSELLRRLLSKNRRGGRPAIASPRRGRMRLRMETLEDRVTPNTYTVNALTDTGAGAGLTGDLRFCITQANANVGVTDTIQFDPTTFAAVGTTITLNSALPSISDPLNIAGTDPTKVVVKRNAAAAAFRIFTLTAAAGNTTFAGMTITGGNSGAGAGINASTATLTVNNCIITGNTGTGEGGAIYLPTTTATLTIANSTISGNTALQGAAVYFFIGGGLNVQNSTISGNTSSGGFSGGGAIYFWGGVSAGGFTIQNSTFTNNSTTNSGGAICFINFTGTANIINSTIDHNTATTAGGGIARTSGTGTLTMVSSILAKNTNAASPDLNMPVFATNCLIGNSTGSGAITGTNNLIGSGAAPIDPLLGPLQANGGTVPTRALLVGSPAIDAGVNANALTTDERGAGFSRTFDDVTVVNGPGSDGTDMGAFEAQPIHPIATASGPNVTTPGGTLYTFTVVYTAVGGFQIDRSTIDSNDILVTGPAGYSQLGTLVSTVPVAGNATTITATYTIVPPGGTWDGTDDGNYVFNMRANQVFDTESPTPQPVPAGAIGSFNVLIPLSLVVTNANDAGPGSLRAALITANAFATADSISFDPNFFTAATPRTITLTTGTLPVSDSVFITGPGANVVTVNGNNTFQVFNIDDGKAGAINVSMSGLTIAGGHNLGPGGGLKIANENVTLTASVLSGNNSATDFTKAGVYGYGGGAYVGRGGRLTVTNCTITGNGAEKAGGGIAAFPGAVVTVTNSQVIANQAVNGGGGGGLFAAGAGAAINVTNSTVSNNVADTFGGGVDVIFNASATVLNSTISGNTAELGGGVFAYYYGSATVRNSTVSGNLAQSSGGGIYGFLYATLTVQNSTVSGNTANAGGNFLGYPGSGGGIGGAYGTAVTITSTIVAKNQNGIAPDVSGPVTANFSIIGIGTGATISGGNDLVGTVPAPVDPLLGPLQDNGGPTFTMLPAARSASAVATLSADVTAADTVLPVSSAAPFLPNQFLIIDTEEMRVVSVNAAASTVTVQRGVRGTAQAAHTAGASIFLTSPAIDGGSNPTGLTTDQRGSGFTRSFNGQPDIGSVEVQPTLVPTVTVNQAAGQIDPTRVGPILFTVTFSTPVHGFTAAGVDLSQSTVGGALVPTVTQTGASTYTISVSGMNGQGTVVARLQAGVAFSNNGNLPNNASTSTDNTVTFDNVSPAVTINQASGQIDPTNGPMQFTVVFSEPVVGFNASKVTITNTGGGVPVVSVSGSGPTYTVTVTGFSGQGTITATIPAGAVTDPAGNPSLASTSTDNQISYDTLAPGVTINQVAGQADPTNASPIRFVVVFSAPVTGFGSSPGAISFAGSTAPGALTYSIVQSGPLDGTTYTVSVTGMTGSGLVVASVPAGVATAGNGHSNVPSTSTDNQVTYDVTAPSVTVTPGPTQNDPTRVSPIVFTVTFSEPVVGFSQGDIQLSGTAGATSAVLSGSGPSYTVTVTGMTQTGTVVITIPAGACTDLAGNPNTAGSGTINYDITAPTVTIDQAATQPDPTSASPVVFTAVFSEPVTGFLPIDVILGGTANPTTAAVTDSGDHMHFTVSVSGMTQNGTVTASVKAGGAFDLAGNPSDASTSTDNTVTYDTASPTVTINQAAAQGDPTRFSPILFTAIFSEPVTGFTGAGVTLLGTAGATTAVVTDSGDHMHFTVSVSGMTRDGTVIADIKSGQATDLAGNPNLPSTSSDHTVTYDTTAPTVTVNQAAGQVDPTNTSPVRFDVVFSEPVVGFTSAGVALSGTAGATTAVVTDSGDHTHFTITVSGMVRTGTVIASVKASAADDLAGNVSVASTSTDNIVTYDITAPTATITSATGDPTNKSPFVVTVTFSEPVFGFTINSLTVGNGTPSGFAASPGGKVYSFALTPTNQGLVTVSIAAGAAQDAAGNPNVAPPVFTRTYDTVAPTVTLSGPSIPSANSGQSVSFTVTYADLNGVNVTLTAADVVLNATGTSNATVTVSGSGNTRTVTLTNITGDGTLSISLPANTATDAAGNPAPAAGPSAPVTTVAPAVTAITINGPSLTNATVVSWTVTFSQPVSGVGSGNFTLTGSGSSGASITSVSGSGTTYQVTAATGADGRLTLNFDNGTGITPPVGGFIPLSGQSYTVSKARPAVTLSTSSPTITSAVVVPVSVTFSKPVTGFSAASLVLTNATVQGFSGSGTDYSFLLKPLGQGPFGVTVPDGAGVDAAGNPSLPATLSLVSDNGPPIVDIEQAAGQTDPADFRNPVLFAVSFSEPVTGFSPAGVVIGGTAGAFAVAVADTGDHQHYAVEVLGMRQAGTVTASIKPGAASDAAGNPNFASFSADNTVTVTVPTGGTGGATVHLSAVGADAGGGPHVKAFNADGSLKFSFFAYDAGFTGGVRVATGDVNGDGVDDIITAAGAGGGPHVKVFDGVTGQQIMSFFAYDAGFTGGVFVAAGDLNGDGHAEIITGAGAGGGPHVKAFDGATGAQIAGFFAYDGSFTGGVRVAAGDVNGDGHADIITGAGAGGGPHVKAFDGTTGALLKSFFAFDPGLTTGVFVAAGDVTGVGHASIIVAQGAGGSEVRVFDGVNGALTLDTLAFPGQSGLVADEFSGGLGIRVGAADFNGDGRPDILVVTGPGTSPRLHVLDGLSGVLLADQAAYDPGFLGGVYVR